ncbi:GNAT family N-acetyltransferase [Arthrobacter caoxuetaonis]|uniref:GNAT family N-acetyltransferase n=1 Tax=Arthrobacter caoxuetaonis TaxID=2886935 RepID=UPI001D140CF4|nr:GNAT family N-acetyltransferase [Arthrobacter caoxuetaonis]MCC3283761.1 GNAT family N-acetyltransferase [Arthrobacter caoxuetaonis]
MTFPDGLQLPGNETGLSWRSITPADLDDWYALTRRIVAEDKPGWAEERADLEHVLSRSSDDPARDTIVGLDPDGVPRAFGGVSVNPDSVRVAGFGGVDPQWRRRGIGTAVFRWQEARAKQRVQDRRGGQPVLRSYAEANNPSAVALLESAGARIVRYFTEMTRPLAGELPEVPLPEGLSFVTFSEELSERFRLAHNEAFQDHWGSEPRDQESWTFTVSHPQFRADWSFAVVEESSGGIAAYQLASFDPESKEILGYTEGYTELLGVLRGWRGMRIAPAMLSEAMRRFRDSGMENAGLGVDTENPSGALKIYEQLGYRPVSRQVVFDKPLDAGSAA